MDGSINSEILLHALNEYNKERHAKERKRDIAVLIFSLIAFIITVIVGTIIYIYLFNLSWIDALYNAALIVTAISVEVNPMTTGQKLFIIIYSLIAVILLISIATDAIRRIFDIFVKLN
jgi:hypothetical protein